MMTCDQQAPQGMWDCVLSALRKYATFRGRATRAEFWWFQLFSLLLTLPPDIAERVLRHAAGEDAQLAHDACLYLRWLLRLALFVPMLAVAARRLHDTGRSGRLVTYPFLLIFIAIPPMSRGIATLQTAIEHENSQLSLWGLIGMAVGAAMLIAALILLIYILFCSCQDSTPGPNKYGPSPKYPAS